jgi:hypothetical protein
MSAWQLDGVDASDEDETGGQHDGTDASDYEEASGERGEPPGDYQLGGDEEHEARDQGAAAMKA